MNSRLVNDCATAMATHLLQLVENLLRPEERQTAYEEFVAVCKAGVESYEVMRERMEQRLQPIRPSTN